MLKRIKPYAILLGKRNVTHYSLPKGARILTVAEVGYELMIFVEQDEDQTEKEMYEIVAFTDEAFVLDTDEFTYLGSARLSFYRKLYHVYYRKKI